MKNDAKGKAKGASTAASHTKTKRDQFVGKKKSPTSLYIIIALVALSVMGGVLFLQSKSGTTSAVQATPEEAKYIGKYLPQGFEPTKLTEPIKYDRTIEMTPVQPEVKDGKIRLNAGDVIGNKIVYFEYTRPSDGQVISMMAYIRPSGKLFTGVSFCPPCQGKYHHFEADGTLTCNQCGTKRDPETQVGLSGACKLYPADEFAHKLVGDKIEIAEADLANWASQPLDRPVGGQ